MNESLEDLLNAVCDEASFVRYIRALGEDFAAAREEEARNPQQHWGSQGARGWENGTIDAFFERAVAWVEESAGRHPVAASPWRRCAEILRAGRHYE